MDNSPVVEWLPYLDKVHSLLPFPTSSLSPYYKRIFNYLLGNQHGG